MREILVVFLALSISACASTHDALSVEEEQVASLSAIYYLPVKVENTRIFQPDCRGGFVPLCTVQSGTSTCNCASIHDINALSRDRRIQFRGSKDRGRRYHRR